MIAKYVIILSIVLPCFCQRPFYAGNKPIGFPEIISPRPSQLNGDDGYANMLNKLPVDQQPFWLLNKDKYIEHMKNPKTWPQRPSFFNENQNSAVFLK
ncbi:hypothetical protein ABMA28_017243 [Loxostege sticticalis]|uniref:Uncharacterized protein n=1 Tax=Loxostege sticticalis TaxID=481309 RepID=A0ABD0S353_LOXSC